MLDEEAKELRLGQFKRCLSFIHDRQLSRFGPCSADDSIKKITRKVVMVSKASSADMHTPRSNR